MLSSALSFAPDSSVLSGGGGTPFLLPFGTVELEIGINSLVALSSERLGGESFLGLEVEGIGESSSPSPSL